MIGLLVTVFTAILYTEIHAVKSKVPKQVNVRKYESFDPIPPVADLIVQEASLLCFDEFQVIFFYFYYISCVASLFRTRK